MQQQFFCTIFPNVRTTIGRRYNFNSIDQFYKKHIESPSVRETKDGPLLSLGAFRGNQRRGDLWQYACGVVLDYDNKFDRTLYEEVLEAIDFSAILYTTFSHSEDQHRFRVIVPCDGINTQNDYREACYAVLDRIGISAGFDESSLSALLSQYLPACPMRSAKLYRSSIVGGEFFCFGENKREETKVVETEIAMSRVSVSSGGGRNEVLKAQAAAALGKGVSFEQCVQELILFDRLNHERPLFEDASEGNIPGNPEANAMRFVANIWFSHARKGERPNVGGVGVQVVHEEVRGTEEPKEEKYEKELFVLPEKLALGAPGLVGEIAGWINSTATKEQPVLALASALCCVATLKGHRVQTETGLRTNLYILGLAPSGSGKEHPARCIQLLMEQADCGQLISGEPASDVGLLKGLRSANGRALIIWDEIGHALQAITGDRASPHERKILKLVLQLFSKANSVFRGKEYANFDGKMERQDIDQPCLSVFGTTVPERFAESLKSAHVADGFLPRWLVFQVADPDVPDRTITIPEDAPESLISAIKGLEYLPTNVRSQGSFDSLMKIRPAIIEMTPSARVLSDEIRQEFNRLRRETRGEITGTDAIWNRGFEHTMKLALTVNEGEKLEKNSIEWAFGIVMNCLQSSCVFASTLTDSEFEKKSNRVLDIIQKRPGIKNRDLMRCLRFAAKEREQILKFLQESEQILCKLSISNSNNKTGTKTWWPSN